MSILSACGEPGDEDARVDLFAALPECTAPAGDGRLDLGAACAEGVCSDDTYAEWVAALGEPDCGDSYTSTKIECSWGGLRSIFEDDDQDGMVDNTAEEIKYFYVEAPYTGSTAEGLTGGVDLRCFVDAYGDPDDVTLELVGDEYAVSEMKYDYPDITIRDEEGGGFADELVVWGD
jgi:hypothetical protein